MINQKPSEILEGNPFQIRESKVLTIEEVFQIIEINKAVFENESFYLTVESIQDFLSKESGVIFLAMLSGKIVGYSSCCLESDAKDYFDGREGGFSNDVLYFSELAIAGKQGMGVFLKLFSSVLDKAKTLKVKKVSMHARKNNGLSDLIQKRYRATFVRAESNFFGSGEDFDYLEILIN